MIMRAMKENLTDGATTADDETLWDKPTSGAPVNMSGLTCASGPLAMKVSEKSFEVVVLKKCHSATPKMFEIVWESAE